MQVTNMCSAPSRAVLAGLDMSEKGHGWRRGRGKGSLALVFLLACSPSSGDSLDVAEDTDPCAPGQAMCDVVDADIPTDSVERDVAPGDALDGEERADSADGGSDTIDHDTDVDASEDAVSDVESDQSTPDDTVPDDVLPEDVADAGPDVEHDAHEDVDATEEDTEYNDASDDVLEPDWPAPPGTPPWADEGFSPGLGREAWGGVVHGDGARWERGPQGGYHLWGAWRAEGPLVATLSALPAQQYRTVSSVERRDGTRIAQATRRGGFRLVPGEEVLVADGLWMVLVQGISVRALEGEPLLLHVRIDLEGAILAEARVWLRSECCD